MFSRLPESQASATDRFVDQPARAPQVISGSACAVQERHNSGVRAAVRADEPFRTEESRRSEESYRNLENQPRPLIKARGDVSAALNAAMLAAFERGDDSLSNVAVGRACGVDEKIVREWRNGERPFPGAALVLLPSRLYDDVIDGIARHRGRCPRPGHVLVRQGLDAIEAQAPNKDERAHALIGIQCEVALRLSKVVGQ